jgi:hypothetical protein
MAKVKRPFRKLKGVPPLTDAYAIEHDRRPFVFGMTFSNGSTAASSGCVLKEDCERLSEIFKEIHELATKPNPEPKSLAAKKPPKRKAPKKG